MKKDDISKSDNTKTEKAKHSNNSKNIKKAETTDTKKPKSKGKKIAIVIISIFLILFILIAILFAIALTYINNMINLVEYDESISEGDIIVNSKVAEDISNYRNIVLFGLDARADTFSPGNRSDCIILVTINNTTHDVALTSVYRDTYLDIDGYGLDKVTHAYSYGGALLAMNTLNKNLDLNISEYVTVNFDTVKTVVDSIGGVTINITSAEAGSGSIPGISTAGRYNLNGEQALAYSRIRKIDTDYKRTERMRTVLTEIFNKVQSMDIGQLNNLLNIVLPHIRTNINQNEIINLIPQVLSFNIKDSEGWPYETRGKTMYAWYGIPITLESNVQKLHANLFNSENYEVSDTVKEISNKIVNVTGYNS